MRAMRVAGVLIVVFAQPVGRITRLTVDDIATDRNSVAIRFGDTAITLPEPLAGHLRELIAERRRSAAAVVPETRSLFPGGAPGRPIGDHIVTATKWTEIAGRPWGDYQRSAPNKPSSPEAVPPAAK